MSKHLRKVKMSWPYTEHGQTLEAGKVYRVTESMARHLVHMGKAIPAAQNASVDGEPESFATTTAEVEAVDLPQTTEPSGSDEKPAASASAKPKK